MKDDKLENFGNTFDTNNDSQNLETITELTEDTSSQDGFNPTTNGMPPLTTADDNNPNSPKNNKKSIAPFVIIGLISLIALLGLGFAFSQMKGTPKQPSNETPITFPEDADKKKPNEKLGDDIVVPPSGTNTASQPKSDIGLEDMTTKPVLADPNKEDLLLPPTNPPVTQPTNPTTPQNVVPNGQGQDVVQPPVITDAPVVNKVEQKTTVTETPSKTETTTTTTTTKVEPTAAPPALSGIEAELVGKTPEEQVALLKNKVVSLEQMVNSNVCVNPVQKKNNVIKSTKPTKKIVKRTNTSKKVVKKSVKHGNLNNVVGFVEGELWIKQNGVTKSYVVGDKLPNGKVIKNINNNTRVVTTSGSSYKIN